VLLGGREFTAAYATISHPGKGHDRLLCMDGFAGAADGATPLGAGWPDAGEFAGTALASLARAAGGEPSSRELWAAAITAAAGSPGAVQPFVSCSVAIARTIAGDIEVAVLGDCTAVVELTDGRRVTLHDPAVPRADAQCAGLPPAERAECHLRNRRRMNTPGGYWIFATDPAAAEHVRTARLPPERIAAVLLCTDGFAAGVDLGGDLEPSVARAAPERFADDAAFVLLSPAA
jgi:Protein phosphatase 2C